MSSRLICGGNCHVAISFTVAGAVASSSVAPRLRWRSPSRQMRTLWLLWQWRWHWRRLAQLMAWNRPILSYRKLLQTWQRWLDTLCHFGSMVNQQHHNSRRFTRDDVWCKLDQNIFPTSCLCADWPAVWKTVDCFSPLAHPADCVVARNADRHAYLQSI